MMFTRRSTMLASLAVLDARAFAPAQAEAKKDFKVGWSIYVGWMPWGYAIDQGIVKKWADRYGITAEVTQFNDHVESINQYTAGSCDAGTVTNMDAQLIPAAEGVDTTSVIVGDFYNGFDAAFVKGGKELAEIRGKPVNLVEYSVSEYLLARALESIGLTKADVKVVNTADPDMVGVFQTPDVQAIGTWNPMVSEIAKLPRATTVFDSAQIPGEIMDLMGSIRPSSKTTPISPRSWLASDMIR
jgi:NitT/TauT family transport system substrate-binding protein